MLIKLLTWLVVPGKTTRRKSGDDYQSLLIGCLLLALACTI